MKVNEHVAVSTPKVLLVPYESLHVEKYHGWMQDVVLREATASEQLTLPEEHENQQSWRASADKLTFILCRPVDCGNGDDGDNGDATNAHARHVIRSGVDDAPDRMLGDINMFIHNGDGDDDDGDDDGKVDHLPAVSRRCVGEINIMVAEEDSRGRGVGFAAVCTLVGYLHRHREATMREYEAGASGASRASRASRAPRPVLLKDLVVKIKASNGKSEALFGRAGFTRRGGVNYFGEIEMALEDFGQRIDNGGLRWWEQADGEYEELVYQRGKGGR